MKCLAVSLALSACLVGCTKQQPEAHKEQAEAETSEETPPIQVQETAEQAPSCEARAARMTPLLQAHARRMATLVP